MKRPSDFKLIEGDDNAQRLICAWPHLEDHRRDLLMEGMAEDWAELAQVPIAEVLRIAPLLVRTGMVLPDGTASPMALQFIEAAMMAKMTRGRGVREPKEPKRPAAPAVPEGGES